MSEWARMVAIFEMPWPLLRAIHSESRCQRELQLKLFLEPMTSLASDIMTICKSRATHPCEFLMTTFRSYRCFRNKVKICAVSSGTLTPSSRSVSSLNFAHRA